MITDMDNNRREITRDLATLVFYMQGGINFDDAHLLSNEQRQIFSKVIQKHYDAMSGKKGGNIIG